LLRVRSTPVQALIRSAIRASPAAARHALLGQAARVDLARRALLPDHLYIRGLREGGLVASLWPTFRWIQVDEHVLLERLAVSTAS